MKTRYDLVPPHALRHMAEVLTWGVPKHGDHGWTKRPILDYYNATIRHLEAWRSGEALDPESNLPHLAHAAVNAMLMVAIAYRKTGE